MMRSTDAQAETLTALYGTSLTADATVQTDVLLFNVSYGVSGCRGVIPLSRVRGCVATSRGVVVKVCSTTLTAPSRAPRC